MSTSQNSPDRRCIALARTTGERCRRWAIAGGRVCPKHGGGAPQVKAAARRRLQLDELKGNLGALLEELELDGQHRHPIEILLDAVHRCHSMAQVLGALVGGLSTDASAPPDGFGATALGVRLWGPNHLGDGAPHVLLNEYGVWLERSARASKLALDAGVDERRVRMAETMAEQLAAVLRGTADEIVSMVKRALGVEHRDIATVIEAKLATELPKMVRRNLETVVFASEQAADRERQLDSQRGSR